MSSWKDCKYEQALGNSGQEKFSFLQAEKLERTSVQRMYLEKEREQDREGEKK